MTIRSNGAGPLIVRLLRICQEEQTAWRESYEDTLWAGYSVEVAACDGEIVAWRRRAARCGGRGADPSAHPGSTR